MKQFILSILITLFFTSPLVAENETNIPEFLESVNVLITGPHFCGSGIVFTRKDSTETNDITFIWTAGHLVLNDETPSSVFDFLGVNSTNKIYRFTKEFQIIQVSITNGEAIITNSITANVIAYSRFDKEDVAILRVQGKFYNTNTITFDLSGRIPKISEKLYSVTCPEGKIGSFSEGHIAFVGRIFNGQVYDQTTCAIAPGSSGGLICTTNGLCIGTADMVEPPVINYIVPIRVIQKWAKKENLEWALDPCIPIPPNEVLQCMEDVIQNPYPPIVKKNLVKKLKHKPVNIPHKKP